MSVLKKAKETEGSGEGNWVENGNEIIGYTNLNVIKQEVSHIRK